MDKSQVEKLKHRKKMFGVGSEEKWNIIYEILFPDTVPGTLPSPCESSSSTATVKWNAETAYKITTTPRNIQNPLNSLLRQGLRSTKLI